MFRLPVLLKIGLLSSLATVFMFTLQFPLFTPYLKYDMSEVPALIAGFALGPWAGVAVICIKNLLFLAARFQPLELVGIPLNTLAGITLVVTSSTIYRLKKTRAMAVLSLVLGVVAMTLVMIPANLLLYPVFAKAFLPSSQMLSRNDLLTLILSTITPFNLVKGMLSASLTFIVYKRFSALLKTEPLWKGSAVSGKAFGHSR